MRLQVAVGPWTEALADATQTAILWAQLDAAVNSIIAGGLGVIICMYDSYDISAYSPGTLLGSGIAGSAWLNRITTTQNFAAHINNYWQPADVAFELFNEPIAPASILVNTWDQYQATLYTAARAYAPVHTVIVTAPNWSAVDQIALLNPASFDANTLFAPHTYLPYIFAQQGYQNGYNNWANDLTWPPAPSHKAASIANMTANVNADGSLTAPQKTATIASQTTDLNYFFDIPEDIAYVNQYYFDVLAAWCTTNSIAHSRVIITEWGTTRTNAGGYGGSAFTGVAQASRVAWKSDMKSSMISYGFRSTEFAYDDPRYGITTGTGNSIGTINT